MLTSQQPKKKGNRAGWCVVHQKMGSLKPTFCFTEIPKVGTVGICYECAWRVLDKTQFEVGEEALSKRKMPQRFGCYDVAFSEYLGKRNYQLIGMGGWVSKMNPGPLDKDIIPTLEGRGVGSGLTWEDIKAAMVAKAEKKKGKTVPHK